jgi:hypothetical protein
MKEDKGGSRWSYKVLGRFERGTSVEEPEKQMNSLQEKIL